MRYIVTFIISLILVSCVKDELKVYQVDITSNEGGRVEGLYLKSEVLEGQSITITAVPSNENYQNYIFTGWSGTISSTENPLNIVISNNISATANFRLRTILEDELYSQIDYNDPYSFLDIFIKDAERYGVDLSNVDVDNGKIKIDYELGEGAYSVLPCDPNKVYIVYGGNLWDRRNDDLTNKYWAIAIMWHELGHDILGLDHLCKGGHIMSGRHTPCQGEEGDQEFKVMWDFRYNSPDNYLNFQRANEEMFLMVDQYKINCNPNSGKGNFKIYN